MPRGKQWTAATSSVRTRHGSAAGRGAKARPWGPLRWLRAALLVVFVAPLLAAPGTAESPLGAGVGLFVAPLLLGCALLRLFDRLLPAHIALPGGLAARRAPLARGLTLLALALLTTGSVALPGFGGSVPQAAAAPIGAQFLPMPIPGMWDVAQVVADGNSSYALKRDGSVWSWGDNQSGQLGNGTYADRAVPGPVCIDGSGMDCDPLTDVVRIAVGGRQGFAIKSDGTLWRWGGNAVGGTSLVAIVIPELTDVRAVASSVNTEFAVTGDGALWAWGVRQFGSLGDGATCAQTQQQQAPLRLNDLIPDLPPMVAVMAGDDRFAAAVDEAGNVWTWGRNDRGALGRITETTCPGSGGVPVPYGAVPEPVAGVGGVTAVDSGTNFMMALVGDGTVWAWGVNQQGQLGDGTHDDRPTPIQVPGVSGVVGISNHGNGTIAVTANGDMRGWNHYPLPNIRGVAQAALGGVHQLLLVPSGQVYGYGFNNNGELGLEDTYDILHNAPLSTPWAAHAGQGVNVAFGSFHHQQADLAVPGRGAGLALVRTYNSSDPTDSGFGPGWSFTYGMAIANFQTATAAGMVVRMGDGRHDRYVRNPDGSYTPPPGIYNTLAANAPDYAFTLTTPDQLVYRFGDRGRLASIADRNGNTTMLTWSASSLTVTEAAGRQFVLTYEIGVDFGHFVRLEEVGILGRAVEYRYHQETGDLSEVLDVRDGMLAMAYHERLLTHVYDQNGFVVVENIWDPDTSRVLAQRDANSVWNAEVVGSRQDLTLNYDSPGATAVTDRRGHPTTYRYDHRHRLTQIIDAKNNPPLTFSWDDRNDLRCVTDRKHNRIGYRYDVRGNVDRIVPPESANAACEPTAANKVYEFTYTARNDIQTATYPAVPLPLPGNPNNEYRRHFTYGYDGNGNLLTVAMPLGHNLTYDPDPANGDVRSVTDHNGFTVHYEYSDPYGNRTAFTDPSIPAGPGIERRTRFEYDNAGRVVRRIDPLGAEVAYEYTEADELRETRVTIEPDVRYAVTIANYDPAGRLDETRNAEGHWTTYHRDINGNPRAVTVAAYGDVEAVTLYQYDANNNVRVRTDPDGLETTYEYDAVDLLERMVEPLSAETEYGYDANGNRTSMTDPNGLITRYDYDPQDRLKQIDYGFKPAIPARDVPAFPGYIVSYTYDLLGQRRSMTDATTMPTNPPTTYGYDELGRLTSVAGQNAGVQYQYDLTDPACPIGKATKVIYPGGNHAAISCYNEAYRLTRVRDWNNGDYDYTYDNAGRLRTLTYPNQTRANYSYDAANRLTGVMHELLAPALDNVSSAATPAAPGMPGLLPGTDPADTGLPRNLRFALFPTETGPFFTQHLGLDNLGNRVSLDEPLSPLGQSGGYSYDAQGRLRGVNYAGGTTIGYTYSPNGHRETATYNGTDTRTSTYDGAKRLQTAFVKGVQYTYEHDNNGNQTYSQSVGQAPTRYTTLGYDGANQLAWSQSNEAVQLSTTLYEYNGDGLLVRRFDSLGGIEALVWDVNRDVPVVLDDGIYEYVYGVGNAPLARLPKSQPNTAAYYHRDGLGSTRVTTDQGRHAVAICDYDPWGASYEPADGCAELSAFAGERQDGVGGAYYLRARRYDPHTGRFTQPDPIGYAGGGNLYAYAGNNPQTYVDPLGLAPEGEAKNIVPIRYTQADLDRQARQGLRRDWTVAFEMTLNRADWGTNGDTHEKRANAALDAAIRADPQLAGRLSRYSPTAVGETLRSNGRRLTPGGWTWHHHASWPGVMQLVLQSEHQAGSIFWRAMHPYNRGGYKNWAEPAGAKPRRGEH